MEELLDRSVLHNACAVGPRLSTALRLLLLAGARFDIALEELRRGELGRKRGGHWLEERTCAT